MADLDVQDIGLLGVGPTYASADAAGDRFQPRTTRPVLVHIKNDDASAHTMTLIDPTSQEPRGATAFDPDVEVNIPATEERFVSVESRFIDADGWVNLQWDAVTSVTVSILRPL